MNSSNSSPVPSAQELVFFFFYSSLELCSCWGFPLIWSLQDLSQPQTWHVCILKLVSRLHVDTSSLTCWSTDASMVVIQRSFNESNVFLTVQWLQPPEVWPLFEGCLEAPPPQQVLSMLQTKCCKIIPMKKWFILTLQSDSANFIHWIFFFKNLNCSQLLGSY